MHFLSNFLFLCLILSLSTTVVHSSSAIQKVTTFDSFKCLSSNVSSIFYQETRNCVPLSCGNHNFEFHATECVETYPKSFPKGSVVFIENSNQTNCDSSNNIVDSISIYMIGKCSTGSEAFAQYGIMTSYLKFTDCETVQVYTDPYNFGCSGSPAETLKITKNCSNGVSFKCY